MALATVGAELLTSVWAGLDKRMAPTTTCHPHVQHRRADNDLFLQFSTEEQLSLFVFLPQIW